MDCSFSKDVVFNINGVCIQIFITRVIQVVCTYYRGNKTTTLGGKTIP